MYHSFYNSAEFIDDVKSKVLENFLVMLNEQNNMNSACADSQQLDQYKRNNGFKAFIEKGNHGTIVKTMLNRRSWWSIQESHDDEYDDLEFIWTQWLKQNIIETLPTELPTQTMRTYGKIEDNYQLTNKKNLFLNLTEYYEKIGEDYSENIPLTYLIEGGSQSQTFQEFRQYFTMLEPLDGEDNKWI